MAMTVLPFKHIAIKTHEKLRCYDGSRHIVRLIIANNLPRDSSMIRAARLGSPGLVEHWGRRRSANIMYSKRGGGGAS